MTFACMPDIPTFKASSLATLTDCSVRTNAWFPDDFATVRLRTPFQFFIFTHSHIFLDDLEFMGDFLRTKPLDLLCLVHLGTFLLHARQHHCVSIVNPRLQMTSVAVDAEPMFALQRKEVIFLIIQVACLTHFTLIDRVYLSIKVMFAKTICLNQSWLLLS